MILNATPYLLRAVSEGHISWREACHRLGLSTFDELDNLLKANGLSLFQPDEETSAAKMAKLNQLLYHPS